jgi:hypothetical protein
MAKKKIVWYGITKANYDIKIREVEVERVTESRLYIADTDPGTMNWNRKFCNKDSSYEAYFPTREEAVAEKLKLLKRAVKAKDEQLAAAKKLLAEFKEQENV